MVGRVRRVSSFRLAGLTEFVETKAWLETHIWHAKRMKMIDIWGYRLVSLFSLEALASAHKFLSSRTHQLKRLSGRHIVPQCMVPSSQISLITRL